MDSIYGTAIRNFIIETVDRLHATSVSKFEAFQIGLELLAWGKISYESSSEAVHKNVAISDNSTDRLQKFIAREASALFPGAFTTLIKLCDLSSSLAVSLMHHAERLATNGSLAHPCIDDLMPPPATGSDNSAIVIPPELAELMLDVAMLTSDKSVYTPWDFYGCLAVRANLKGHSVCLESPIHSGVPLLIKILTSSKIKVRYANPIFDPWVTETRYLQKFDVSLSIPPIGARYEGAVPDPFRRFPERTNSGSLLALQHLLAQTTRRVVVAVPTTLLFSIGTEKKFRESLVEKGIIRAVIAMPDGLLENVSCGIAVLILDPSEQHQYIRFIDASSDHFHDRLSRTRVKLKNVKELSELVFSTAEDTTNSDVAVVSTAEVIQHQSNLQVNQYVLPASTKRARQYLAQSQTLALKDLVTTVRHLPLGTLNQRFSDSSSMEVFEVGALDLPEFGFISQPKRKIEFPASALNEHSVQFLQPYDIVLIIKGNVGKVGIVPETVPNAGENGWVVGQSAIILRPRNVSPIALFMLLRSPLGKILLKGVASGATTTLIQLGQLMALRIPQINTHEKLQATDALIRESRIQTELERLRKEQANIATELWSLE